ncbi:MAG TPA: DUF1501 domain-containing protein [Hyphomicrobium sp.]|nr:DUF1501 domain-containing protein [Hyphomicrobium sp.]
MKTIYTSTTRRDVLRSGAAALALSAAGEGLTFGLTSTLARAADETHKKTSRILVVLELSGANDGLNTLAPYGDDAYYTLRPQIGIRADKLLKIDDHHGFNRGMKGFERLYKEGKLAVIHGCGYAQPSFSHFTSMAYWHTAAPNSGQTLGWVGRLADTMDPAGASNYIVNIAESQSLAVNANMHTPVVFNDPDRFIRKGDSQIRPMFDVVEDPDAASTNAQKFLRQVAISARDASQQVREAWSRYKTPVDYGIIPLGLNKIASLIAADMPTRLYYTSYPHNTFDTHVHQVDAHARYLTYTSDAVEGFMRDLERIGRADDVAILIFSEFGRRAAENTSLGTDHGTANLMFVVGKSVRGGHYGAPSSLTRLMPDGNLEYTTDFRRVYATMIEGWLHHSDSASILRDKFQTFPLFA